MALLRDMLFGNQSSRPAAAAGGGAASPDKLAFGRQVYDFFLSKGMAPHQAAAIAGNMAWEGGGRADLVNPNDNAKNSPNAPHSVGIAQWNDRSPALLDFARKQGVDIPQGDMRDVNYMRDVMKRIPLQTQLAFAHQEMQGPEARAGKGIAGATDLRGATAAAIGYHRPAGWTSGSPEAGHGFSGRLSLADQIMRGAQTSPQPPDGMDATTYAGATPPPATPSPSATPTQSPPTPSGGLLAGLFDGEGQGKGLLGGVLPEKGLLGGILPEGISKYLGGSDGAGAAAAMKAASTEEKPLAPQIQPMQLPRLDMANLRALMQRRGMLGTMGG